MKYLLGLVFGMALSYLCLIILRKDISIWLYILTPAITLLAGIYLHFFRPEIKNDFTFALFSGSVIANIFVWLIILFMMAFRPFQ